MSLFTHYRWVLTLLWVGLSVNLAAQNGTIRGKVTSGNSGEPLLGATVRVLQGQQMRGGAYTDLEGTFSAALPAGTYTLVVSYISFLDDTITNVTVEPGQVVYNDFILFEAQSTREDLAVEITAQRGQASEVALFNIKRTSVNTLDGVSLDLIRRTGDANVAAAMQRVVGVTVTDGKYVFVRGLGDRYSKTLLNGAQIPGLDPDRNTVQMDIFPSNLIDNITVIKNFTPDLPGDFSGGLIDITTRDFPSQFTVSASASTGFNPQANLRRGDFLTYETGRGDWMGRDDGTRAVPDAIQQTLAEDGEFPFVGSFTFDKEAAYDIERLSQSFTTGMGPIQGNSGLNQDYQFSVGNQKSIGSNAIGFIAGLSYRNSFTYYDDLVENRYYLSDSIANQLSNARQMDQVGIFGAQNVLWGALAKVSFKARNHKVSFNYMRNQSGNSSALFLSGFFNDSGQLPTDPAQREHWETRTLQYVERSINSFQLSGRSVIPAAMGLEISWMASYSPSRMNEPDLRYFTNGYEIRENGDTIFALAPSRHTVPGRFFRTLEEDFLTGGIDLKLPIGKAELKMGGNLTYKERSYQETRYQYQPLGNVRYSGSPEAYFVDENVGIRDSTFIPQRGDTRYSFGLAIVDGTLAVNSYDANQTVGAGYLMGIVPLSPQLKLIAGARVETTQAFVQSRDTVNFPAAELDLLDLLPSAALIYAVKPNMNLRFSGYRTLARPSFREFSPLRTFPWVGDYEERGTPGLRRTLIDNLDLRWEWFPSISELVSVSFFYKDFTDPIERSAVAVTTNPYFQYRNVPEANLYGIELEVRKHFGFLGPKGENLQFGGNLSLIRSQVDINEAEYQTIIGTDPERPRTRPMFSQSPYMANAELAYLDEVTGITGSLSYNVFGPRLTLVGVQGTPDVYEQPRQLVNFSLSKRLNKYFSIRLRANNLFNPEYAFEQSYLPRVRDAQGNPVLAEGGGFLVDDQTYTFRSYRIGRSFSLGLSMKF